MTLGYCTNIHPAETWAETLHALETHVLTVRDRLVENGDQPAGRDFPIGLRLSAIAADELLSGDNLPKFKDWLAENRSYVFTINGFPYGSFHGTRVKEKVFQPDWTSPDRVEYTQNLFKILAQIAPHSTGGSASTLPGSHKSFSADEVPIRENLIKIAYFIEDLSQEHQIDLHLGLEPEPLGHFENTAETLAFFERLHHQAKSPTIIGKRIGLNFDSCHFAIEFDDASPSLNAISSLAGIRLSKIHLSNALALDPADPSAIEAIRRFDEPTYFHQVIAQRPDGSLERFPDLPLFLSAIDSGKTKPADFAEARVHFHIPLDSQPAAPLGSTHSHVAETLAWCAKNPTACSHFEIETYTWGVLPENLQRPVEEQIAAEYHWVLEKLRKPIT
ncbi:MAG: metabolite traffic protein EboE [Akkermansiaceae bacterium]|jgi:sugar phosphate isomerase/epimerase|nr:metabolite traffic protein EboE [Akkermansiaceae bacterium]MDP4647529.1 metabolite traffic protein EboE [Akkermansiaceae bacterium]MDP4722474.1 metabolite traffic protein EboE [Akkermansiaceae bacterium]MDP4778640.1 metabolite traffic protein EboE [Akkermansiaceae bacterium]MDP4848311.1 metabolite traffic protein EboE [Akkermansiaceae bacterium]